MVVRVTTAWTAAAATTFFTAASKTIPFSGNIGADLLYGDEGSDSLDGGTSGDTLYGGDGADTLIGGGGDDLLYGDGGNDSLTADAGNDTLHGGADEDTLYGGEGANLLYGGLGDDVFYGVDGDDTLFGGDGSDTLYSEVDAVLGSDMENLVLTGTDDADGTGNALDNVLTGNSGANLLLGLDGDDTLNGGVGADTLDGGAGNDSVDAGAGDDVVAHRVGAGNSNRSFDTFDGGSGNDVLEISFGAAPNAISLDELRRLQRFIQDNGDNGVEGRFDLDGDSIFDIAVKNFNRLVDVDDVLQPPAAPGKPVLSNIADNLPIVVPFAALLSGGAAGLSIIAVSGAAGGTAALIDTDEDGAFDAVSFTAAASGATTGSFVYTVRNALGEGVPPQCGSWNRQRRSCQWT